MEGKQTRLTPGVIARAVQGVRYAISGVTPAAWFGPGQPLQPMAPATVAGRRFDYPDSYNLEYRPRGYEPVGFYELRALADNCDILRSVIETRKDQMESQDWSIKPKANDSDKETTDDQKRRIEAITIFLQSPDRISTWSQWQRQLLEERFVTDAAAVYKRRDRVGRLYALEPLDGATLKVLIDDSGRRPIPPDPAYQQILHGIPAVDYRADEVMYLMRNPRVWKLYGYSEVEQIILTINISIRRAMHQLDYYKEGSQPDAFMGLPKEWTGQQIADFQKHFDSMMAGNLAARRRLKFMPDFKYQETKQPPLKDAYDEWLARVICSVFRITPDAFVQHMNRATAENAHDRALQEGLAPLQRWMKGFLDPIIAIEFASPDLEFSFRDDREQDPMQADTILVNDTKAGIISIDEAREAKGLEPIGGAFATPMALTASGYAPVDPEERVAMTPAPTTPDEEKPEETPKPKAKKAYTGLRKAVRHKPVPFDRPAVRKSRAAMKETVAKILANTGQEVSAQLRRRVSKLAKDDLDLSALLALTTVSGDLETVTAGSGNLALAQIGVEDRSALVDQVNESAVAYARARAAEMVGKRWVDGELVDNPNAAWRIDEATRDEIQDIISAGLEQNIGWSAIADQVKDAGAFSEERADLIASTEIARANSVGSLNGYKAARSIGIKVKKVWLPDSDPCPDCQENADAGAIDLDDDFPSGDDAPPGHPHCECAIANEVEDEDDEE